MKCCILVLFFSVFRAHCFNKVLITGRIGSIFVSFKEAAVILKAADTECGSFKKLPVSLSAVCVRVTQLVHEMTHLT